MKNLGMLFLIIQAYMFVWGPASPFACDKKQIYGKFLSDLYYTNGNDFFATKGKVFVILWKYIDPAKGTVDSVIMSSRLGENNWDQKILPGKAYYLGNTNNNEICSIEKRKGTWKISFYTVDGLKTGEIEHQYPIHQRELSQDPPIPLVCPDGSIIFYTRYYYDLRNPILSFILDWLSGGHGSIPRVNDYIEILPSLLKGDSARDRVVAYVKLEDSSRRTVFAFDIKMLKEASGCRITESISGLYKIYELFKHESCLNFYKKDQYLMTLGDSIMIYDNLFRLKYVASKPHSFPNCSRLRDPGSEQSDLLITEHNQIFFISSSEGLFIYDPRTKRWVVTNVPIGHDYICDMRLFKWGDSLYIGIWYLDKVEISKCSIESLARTFK